MWIFLLMTDIRSKLHENALFKAQSRTRLCNLPNSDETGNVHGRRPGNAKFFLTQGFQQSFGLKNAI